MTDGPVPAADRVALEGGEFVYGSDGDDGYPADGEGPAQRVRVSPFEIDRYAVTNARFAAFVEATGHVTDAERYGWSFVFAGLLPDDFEDTRGVVGAPWWRQVHGADWAHPEGPGSSVAGRSDHPVVHVSWNDADAFARWSDARLPTEAQWELAARGGIEAATFPWGDDLEPDGRHLMNVWQGSFPDANTEADGWYGTAPVGSYPPNGHGLYEMTGNVWEWCRDWFTVHRPHAEGAVDPTGPPDGVDRVMKGGSYLCHHSYCRRYRVAARSANSPDSSASHLGFRTVAG